MAEPGTFLAIVRDDRPLAYTPVNAEVMREACDVIERAYKKVDPKSKTAEGLTALYNLFFDYLAALRFAEGLPQEPSTSPLRKDPA